MGLWKTKYASVNHHEYWAEGVQSWFSNNRLPDHDHNHVDTRKELIEYDPGLANLCREIFGNTKLVYTRAPTRLRAHLKGYDPKTAPEFVWPAHLKRQIEKIEKTLATENNLLAHRSRLEAIRISLATPVSHSLQVGLLWVGHQACDIHLLDSF